MERFDRLIHEQLMITEEMIDLQKEIDFSQSELQLINEDGANKQDLISLLIKIANDKKRLEELQTAFRERTDEVIECYRSETENMNQPI